MLCLRAECNSRTYSASNQNINIQYTFHTTDENSIINTWFKSYPIIEYEETSDSRVEESARTDDCRKFIRPNGTRYKHLTEYVLEGYTFLHFEHRTTNVWWAIKKGEKKMELQTIQTVASHFQQNPHIYALLTYVNRNKTTRQLKCYLLTTSPIFSEQQS